MDRDQSLTDAYVSAINDLSAGIDRRVTEVGRAANQLELDLAEAADHYFVQADRLLERILPSLRDGDPDAADAAIAMIIIDLGVAEQAATTDLVLATAAPEPPDPETRRVLVGQPLSDRVTEMVAVIRGQPPMEPTGGVATPASVGPGARAVVCCDEDIDSIVHAAAGEIARCAAHAGVIAAADLVAGVVLASAAGLWNGMPRALQACAAMGISSASSRLEALLGSREALSAVCHSRCKGWGGLRSWWCSFLDSGGGDGGGAISDIVRSC
jgi:hypothetical protein